MSNAQRSSDVVEIHSERCLSFALCGLGSLAAGWLLLHYTDLFIGLGWVLVIGGFGALCFALFCAMQARKVTGVGFTCPYCSTGNRLTAVPDDDFSCNSCHRLIPVGEGSILEVFQVRCGFCNHLNYYNAKSEGLICEECDREIPISTESGEKSAKLFRTYTQHDDDKQYELVLVSYGHKTEEVIGCLQHMLALNRNQVKDMLGELPATLLTGITRKKAEMLTAQLATHEAAAEFHPVA